MQKNPYAAYSSTSVLSADGVTLTTMLFDGGLKAIRKARLHHESGNRDGYLNEIERASLIVGELLTSLDLSQGDIPQQLSGIYTYCIRRLIDSTLQGPAPLTEVEANLTMIADAWKVATTGLKAATPQPTSSAA
jgi:flagellar protein FliS